MRKFLVGLVAMAFIAVACGSNDNTSAGPTGSTAATGATGTTGTTGATGPATAADATSADDMSASVNTKNAR